MLLRLTLNDDEDTAIELGKLEFNGDKKSILPWTAEMPRFNKLDNARAGHEMHKEQDLPYSSVYCFDRCVQASSYDEYPADDLPSLLLLRFHSIGIRQCRAAWTVEAISSLTISCRTGAAIVVPASPDLLEYKTDTPVPVSPLILTVPPRIIDV